MNKRIIYSPSAHFMEAEAEAQRGHLTYSRSHSPWIAESDTGIKPAGLLTSGLSITYMFPIFVFWLFPPSQPLGSLLFIRKGTMKNRSMD